MQDVLQQLGDLLLGSLPTLALFIFLVLAYQILVQGPLSKTLAERRARTTGAVEEANKAQEREAVTDAARKAAIQRVLEARVALESEAVGARKTLMAAADQLAEQVVRAVMPASAGGPR